MKSIFHEVAVDHHLDDDKSKILCFDFFSEFFPPLFNISSNHIVRGK